MSRYEQGISQFHALRRTAPKGEVFVGVCTQCGMSGLTLKNMNDVCENPRNQTIAEAIIESVIK